MKIRILGAAQQDLVSGFRFYEAQEKGLGSYFLEPIRHRTIDGIHD
jgi:hypothetical protein